MYKGINVRKMNGLMDKWKMNERTMDEWMNGRMNEYRNKYVDQWTNGQLDEQTTR